MPFTKSRARHLNAYALCISDIISDIIGDIIGDITYDITYDIAHDDFYIKHHIIGWNQWLCISDSGLSVSLAPS